MLQFLIYLLPLLLSIGILRKVVLSSSALQNNAVSFTNQTARRMHIRKSSLAFSMEAGAAIALGDSALASLDEVPVIQAQVNDSRSHIQQASAQGSGGTGAIAATFESSVLTFNRNDLVLDPDESIFLNLLDIVGAMPVTASANLWYET